MQKSFDTERDKDYNSRCKNKGTAKRCSIYKQNGKQGETMKKFFTLIITAILGIACVCGLTACEKNSDGEKVKLININLTEEEYAFAMKLDNTSLKTSFNEYLAEIKENGTLDTIMAKYFENKGEKVGYDYNGDGSGSGTSQKTEGKFVVATNCPFSPFEYIDGGKIYGIDMEIAAGYATKHNLELVIQNIDFDAIFPSLDAGYVDIGMAGITESKDRSNYAFTTHYYNASLQLIVAKDNTDFDNCKTKEDVENVLKGLNNKSFGYQEGTTSGDYIGNFTNLKATSYNTAALATYELINGNLYAVVVDNGPAAAIVESYNK